MPITFTEEDFATERRPITFTESDFKEPTKFTPEDFSEGPYKPGAYQGEPVGIPAEVIEEAPVLRDEAIKTLPLKYDRLRQLVGDDPEKLASLNEAYIATSRSLGIEPVGIGKTQPMPRVTTEDIEKGLTIPVVNIDIPPIGKTGSGVVAGVQRAAAGLSEGLLAPEGMAAFVPGSVGKVYGKAFVGSMAASVPEQVKAFSEALGAKDVATAVETGLTLGATGLFIKGALTGGKTKALEEKKAEVVKALEENNAPLTAEALKNKPVEVLEEAKPIEITEVEKPVEAKETPVESKPAVEALASEEPPSETIVAETETNPPDSGTVSPSAPGVDVPIGARKAMTAELRDAVGLGVLPENAGYTLPDIWNEVTQVRTANPLEPAQLAQSVIANPRMLEPVEVGLLTARLVELKKSMNKHAADGEFGKVGLVLGEMDALTGAMKISGGRASKGLNAFRLIAKDDFSLDTMLMREKASKGRELTEPEMQEVIEIQASMEKAQAELDKDVAEGQEFERSQAAEEAVASMAGQLRGEKLRQGKFKGFDQGTRGADVLDKLEGITKTIDPKLIKEQNPNWKPHKDLKKLFQEGGMKADEAISGLGLDVKIGELGEVLNEAARKRKGDKAARRRDERLMKQEEKEALIESKIASVQAMIKAEHAKLSGKPMTFGGGAGFEAALKEIPNIVSWVKIGAGHANILRLKGIKGFTNWKNEMQANYDLKGTGLDKHLQAVYRASMKEALKQSRELKKGQLDLSPAERRANTLMQAKETAAEEGFDKNQDLGRYAKQLAKQHIADGITKMQDVVEAVHADLLSIVTDFTRAETMDAISDYGKVRTLDNNPVNKRARQLRTEIQMTRKLSDALAGEMPKKTGQQREPSTVLTRQLQKQLKDVMAEQGMNQKDPAKQLASALDAKKNTIRNRIAEIKDELATGKRLVRTDKGEIKLDAEGEALQAELDALKKQREAIFGKDEKKPLTDEQKLERATAVAEKDLQKWTQRALDAAEGKGEFKRTAKTKVSSREIEAIKAQAEAAKAEYEELSGLKSRLEAEKKEKSLKTKVEALEKDIAKREAELSTGNFETKGQQANRPQQEPIETLLQRRRELVEQKAAAKKITNQASPEAKQAQAREKELESLEKQIAERQAKIASGDTSKQPRTFDRPAATAELEQARQQLQAVNDQLADMRKQSKAAGKPSVEEMYVKRRLTALTRAEADYQSRIARGDFELPRPKKEAPLLSKAQQEALDKKSAEVERLKQDWQIRQEKAVWDKMNPAGKAVRTLFNTYDAARLIQTTGEMSYILRQGKWTALSNPLLTSKAVLQSLKALVGSRERTMALDEAVFNHPESAQAIRDGLYLTRLGERSLTKQEELIMGRWAENIPVVKNFTQAAHVFMNKLRFDLWRRMKDDLNLTPEESKQLAMFVNESTGRGGLGKRLEPAAVALGRAMYSPRFFASRWQLLTGHSLWGGTSLSRRIIATQYAKSLAGLGLYYALLYSYFSDESLLDLTWEDLKEKIDFRSSKGGKVQVGDTVIDPLAGLAQAITLAERTRTLETMNRSGDVKPLRNPDFGQDSWRDVASRYAWSKAHPVPGTIANLFSGTDLGGNEATLESQAQNYFLPITYFDIYHALKDQGYSDQAALALLGFLGEGLQTYK